MRLIDLDTLLQFLESQNCANDWLVSMYNADWIASWLESQPIIEIDVVRCKDCKYGRLDDYTLKMFCSSPLGSYGCTPTQTNNFCSYGVRREER